MTTKLDLVVVAVVVVVVVKVVVVIVVLAEPVSETAALEELV